jgi:site-specific DNA recombinase
MVTVSGMRALGGGRLSKDSDESTSKERQFEAIELTAKLRGDRLVRIAFDNDVSGAISPFEREYLGPWLTEPGKIEQWDVLIVPKLDRLTRSLFDFADFVKWAEVNKKLLISVSEGIDLSTPAGRMVANIIVAFAQFERERMSERRTEAAEKLRVLGRWNGGRVPYGYLFKEGNGGLQQNPDTAPIVRRIVSEIIAGAPMSVVCEKLTAESVPTPRGAPIWKVKALTKIVSSRYLRGELQYKGHSVLDSDGRPVMITDEPLITEHEWGLLADMLRGRARPRGTYQDAAGVHLLLRIAYCGECGSPMYHQHNGPNDYYRCAGKHGIPAIRAKTLEDAVAEDLLRTFGDRAIEHRASTGKDYASEIRMTERELQELDDQYVAHNISAERFATVSTRIEARLAELRTLAATSDAIQWEPTGETVAQRWERSDNEGRHMMLRRLGARWELRREYRISDHAWRWRFESSWLSAEDAHERLTRVS